MPLVTPPPDAAPLGPPPAACPRCACELHGAHLCEVCGAADFDGVGLWVCFSCGQGNAVEDERCACCRKLHVLACPACGREGYHRDRSCEFCGAARALYPVIRRMLVQAGQPVARPAREERALSLTVVLAVIALAVAAVLGGLGRKLEAIAAGAAAGAAGVAAAVLERRTRIAGQLPS